MEGDDVTPLPELFKGDVLYVAVRGREFVKGDHVHSEAAAYVNEDPADLAGADDADGLAVQVEAREAVQAEVEVFRADVGLVDAPDGGEQEGHGVLCYCVG